MPKKKQVTLQNSIPGKFIPRNALPSGSVFSSRGNDNRFNAKMAELFASSSLTNNESDHISTKSSQLDQKSNDITLIESPNIHSKLFHRRIVTMLETMRTTNDKSSNKQIASSHTEYKSQPITFGQLRKATISSVPAQVTEDKSISYQIKIDTEEKQDKPLVSFAKEHSLNSDSSTSKTSIKRQTNKERLYYSPSLEQLFELQNSITETRSDEKEVEKTSLTVDELLAMHYSKVKTSTNAESHTTTATFYVHPSQSNWNSLQMNKDIQTSASNLILNEQIRNRPPPPSYSASVAAPHRTVPTVDFSQPVLYSSVPPSMSDSFLSGSSISQHPVTGNSSFILSNSTSSLNPMMNTFITNNSSRSPPPRYQSPTSHFERSPSTSSQQLNSANTTTVTITTTHATTTATTTTTIANNNNNNDTNKDKPSMSFDHEFSRLLYGKDNGKTRRRRQKRKAFSDPVKKCVEEANRSFEKARRRVTTNLNKTDSFQEEEEDEEDERENDDQIETQKSNRQKPDFNILTRRRSQRQSNLIEKSRQAAREALVPPNALLKQRIPAFLRVYSQASPSNDVLLQWDLFNLSELETFYAMMSRLYKNENLARVQIYEIYRTVLLSVLASKTSFKCDNENGAMNTAL